MQSTHTELLSLIGVSSLPPKANTSKIHVHGRVVWLHRHQTAKPHLEMYLLDSGLACRVVLWLDGVTPQPPFVVGTDLLIPRPDIIPLFPDVHGVIPTYHHKRELALEKQSVLVERLPDHPWATLFSLRCLPTGSVVPYMGEVLAVEALPSTSTNGSERARLSTEDLRGERVVVEASGHNAVWAQLLGEEGGYLFVRRAILKRTSNKCIVLEASAKCMVEYSTKDNPIAREKWAMARQGAYGFTPEALVLFKREGEPNGVALEEQLKRVARMLDQVMSRLDAIQHELKVGSELVLTSTASLQELWLHRFGLEEAEVEVEERFAFGSDASEMGSADVGASVQPPSGEEAPLDSQRKRKREEDETDEKERQVVIGASDLDHDLAAIDALPSARAEGTEV